MNDHKYLIASDQNKDYGELKKENFFMNRLGPEDLCPFAGHALFPYVFSFKKGSWFRWEKTKNSVTVQCPNPNCNATFRITRERSGVISAEVTGLKNACLAGHKAGDIFELSQADGPPFPRSWCGMNRIESLSVNVLSHNPLCRYCQRAGHKVAFGDLAPRGFCLPAYYVIYPFALSMLYDGVNFDKVGGEHEASLSCNNYSDRIQMKVRTQRNILSLLLNLLEKILRVIGFPKDVLDKSIKIRVAGVKGNCRMGLKTGHISNFNLRSKKEVCPAVSYTLFPFLAMMGSGIFPYWSEEKKRLDVHCPDAGADIVYRINVRADRA